MGKPKVCFLVGSMAISGGTYVIVQHASFLRANGYNVTLAVQEPFSAKTLAWHDEAPKLRCLPIDLAKRESYDLVIATWWKTALVLGDFNASHYAYFVQSIESRFYPAEESALRQLVDATYRLPIAYATEARWIQGVLHTHYGHDSELVRNGIRKDVYRPDGPSLAARDSKHEPRVLVEGHFGVAFKNTALGIRLARKAGASNIWTLTGSDIKWLPGVNRVFSRVAMTETGDIYRSCDILVKLSTVEGMFGPPLEMFHCGGTAVVFDVTGHDEYIINGVNARIVRAGDIHGVIDTLRELLCDRTELVRLKEGALRTANAWPSWADSSALFAKWIERCLTLPSVDPATLTEISKQAFDTYVTDERARILRCPGLVRRHKLSALAARLPHGIVRRIKQIEAIGEVVFGQDRAKWFFN